MKSVSRIGLVWGCLGQFEGAWYWRSLPTHIWTDYLPSPSLPNVKKDKMESVNSLDQLERDAVEEGFFACLPSLVKLMANIQDSGGKMFKVLLSEILRCVHHMSLAIGYWTSYISPRA